MKINNLLESITAASSPENATNSAPTMGRSDKFLEDEKLEETSSGATGSGSVASVSSPVGGVQRRAKGSMFQGIKTSSKYPNSKAVKESVNPQNFDSDVDYYNAVKKQGQQQFSGDWDVQDEIASLENQIKYTKSAALAHTLYQKIDQLKQQAGIEDDEDEYEKEYDADIRARKGLAEEGSDESGSDLKSWQVVIFNNYYAGKYSDYRGRYYYVLASSPEEAKQVVIDNADGILQDLLSMKSHNGKRILPRSSAVRITPDRIGKIQDGTVEGRMSTAGYKKMFSPQGLVMAKLSGGSVVDIQEQEQTVDEAGGNVPSGMTWSGGKLQKRPELVAAAKGNKNYQAYLKRKAAKEKAQQPEQGVDESLEKDFQKVDYRKFSTTTLMNALKTLAKSKTPNVELQKGISRELLNRVKNKEGVAEEKQRLDPKCWTGYKKQGTKMKGGVRVNNCVKVDEAEFTEDKLAQELYKDLQMFKKGIDKDIGAKAKDKDIVAKEESKGLWANIHAKQNRIKNGSGEKMRKPGSKGAPTAQNFKDAANEAANPAQQAAIAIAMKKKGQKPKNESNGEYDDEAGSTESNLLTTARAVKGLLDTIGDRDNLPEWVQEKIAKAEGMLVASWDYLQSQKEQGIDPQVDETLSLDEQFDMIEEMVEELAEAHGVDAEVIWEDLESVEDTELFETAAWRRKEGKNKNGGLNAKGVASYRRENPGSKLQTAVTTKPSKLKPGSKAAKRRKSFCARMGGMKGPMKDKNGKPTRKALALRKWNC